VIRLSKIALALLMAFSISVILFAAARPRSVNAFARHYLYSHSRKFFHHPPSRGTSNLPAVIFWAWERPEDLRFLTPDQAGVAFLAKTIYLQPPPTDPTGSSPSFIVRPRLQPLRIAVGTPQIAVIRMETPAAPRLSSLQQNQSALNAFTYSNAQRALLASEIASTQSISGVSAIQIDFDAPSSAQPFYTALLQDVRGKLPPSLSLSITALASWCIGDPWLAQLPPGTIDEAVPMLFRMGPDAANVAKFLHSGDDFPVAACRGSRGLSTDETLSNDLLTAGSAFPTFDTREKRVYVFAPRSWTPSAVETVLQELKP
jgi:Protein of unknown function (DUF3142)